MNLALSLTPPSSGRLHRDRYRVAAQIYQPEVSPWTLVGIVMDNNDLRHPYPGLPRP